LIAALFPKKADLGGIERVALSFGLSIAVVPLIGLILNYTPWGIRLYPILIPLVAFILVMSIIAWYRRQRVVEGQRFSVSFNIRLPSWGGQGGWDKVLSVVLVVAILGAIGTLAYVIATPKVSERFTEFYILGPEGKVEEYPTELRVGDKGEVILGIVNHEQEETSYQVEVRIYSDEGDEGEVKIWVDIDEDGEFEEVDIIETPILAHEEKWEGKLRFEPQQSGEQKLEFLLFSPKEELSLHLWVMVEE
jgi:uncharacterized membrane protein